MSDYLLELTDRLVDIYQSIDPYSYMEYTDEEIFEESEELIMNNLDDVINFLNEAAIDHPELLDKINSLLSELIKWKKGR